MAKEEDRNWYQSIHPIKLSGLQVFLAILMRQHHEKNTKLDTASKQHLVEQ
jgi:hypothetical protein